jgi:hypothetical protein
VSDDILKIKGTLRSDAVLLYTPGGTHAILQLEIHPAKGLPYRVRQPLGSNPTDHLIARAKLAALKTGAVVAVYAAGLRTCTDHDIAALVPVDVTDVIPLSPPPLRSQHNR